MSMHDMCVFRGGRAGGQVWLKGELGGQHGRTLSGTVPMSSTTWG